MNRDTKFDNEYCPTCGYYCLGNGGIDCIDKPRLCGLSVDKEWNGLTISDIDTTLHAGGVAEQSKSGMWHILPHAFAEKIEALLKEKNT